MPRHILALDQGTTSSRAIVFDEAGATVALAQHEFPQHFPQPGWVEHDPRDLWESQILAAREAIEASGVRAADLAAIGITNQRETALIWDRATGEPIHPAIVWQSRQTASICESWRARGLTDLVAETTGLVIDAYFSASKVRWLLDTVPGAQARAERGELAFGTVDSWLIWRLTGGAHLTDETNASRTMMYDIRTRQWSTALLDAFEVPAALLPEVLPSSADFGVTLPEIFGGSIPIRGVAGDQQAALFGQGCVRPGDIKNTYGTGCFLLMNTGTQKVPSTNGLLTTVACQVEGEPATYALEGSVAMAGATVQWLRDQMGLIADAADVEALARTVDDNGDVYLVPAFSGLFAPHWRSDARGVIVGLTRFANRGHIARAALESTAFQAAEQLDAMRADSGVDLAELRVDGGMVGNDLLMQFQADLLGVDVVRPVVAETTALGAAYAAGLAEGFWEDLGDVRANWQEGRRWEPAMGTEQRDHLTERWRMAVERTMDWV